ncbi:DUF4097 family beta strand repeat-containing protein [Smaragdicoccus niigatensis]|uniref:DUF4097 family beta strand repeat-containing protein n=1 Tax=Smaragdicoccus niigatensis TaxID=359359 RepID=UPI000371B84D|nr:DUF4097 family beta strand repeat-containing protein [Smaragdicoccus niigatensis]
MTIKNFPVTGPLALNFRVGNANVIIRAVAGITEATVSLTQRDGGTEIIDQTVVELKGTELVIRQSQQTFAEFLALFRGRHAELLIDATVPEGSRVRIASRSSEVTIEGRTGTADIATGATNLVFDEIDGDLRFRTGSGQASGRRVVGAVILRSGSGNASLGEVGSVEMGTGAGTLEIGVAHGSVRMRTGSGTASIQTAEGDVDFVSGSGGLTVGLPEGKHAHIDVMTGNGRLDTDLPVSEQAPANGTSTSIRARTGSGDIRLHRSVAA